MMVLPVWIDNLIAYSLQTAALAAAGTLLVYIFRFRVPKVLLTYWQLLLVACLFLPVLQKWEHPVISSTSITQESAAIPLPESGAIPVTTTPTITVSETIIILYFTGVLLRFIWLGLGFIRLRLYLKKSKRLTQKPPEAERILPLAGIQADFYISDKIDCPATFGILSPRILLPRSFPEMSAACRETIVCHELLHVRRRDWVMVMLEECVRTVLWFHPAVWWLLGRIHLAREQTVDYEVVGLTGTKQLYLDSLLEIARLRGRTRAVPAPLFLREHHLVQRVALLIKEVPMNRLRLVMSLVGTVVLLTGMIHLGTVWFPLKGAPVPIQEGISYTENSAPPSSLVRTGSAVMESKLIRKVDPVYPELAKKTRLVGKVILEITVNEEGFVSDIRVVRGNPMLSQAAVDAVSQWQYEPTLLNGRAIPVIATITVNFNLNDSDAEHLLEDQPTQMDRTSPSSPVRAGSAVMESKLIRKVDPIYPELAKKTRLVGKVILEITADEEGFVSDIRVVRGNPMLSQAAVDAVSQWQYEPTILNGQAVPVIATVTVDFNLNDSSGVGPR